MFLRELPITSLKTGDKVISSRGRLGRILLLEDFGVSQHKYFILWSTEGKWENEKQLVSEDANVHEMNSLEYPVTDKDIKYLG